MILPNKKRVRTEVESLLLQEMVADDSSFLLVGDSDGEDIFPDDEVTEPGLFDNDSEEDDNYEDDESDEDDSYILDILGREF